MNTRYSLIFDILMTPAAGEKPRLLIVTGREQTFQEILSVMRTMKDVHA